VEYYSQRYIHCSLSRIWSGQEPQSLVSESDTGPPAHPTRVPTPAAAPRTYPRSLQERHGAALVRGLGSLVRLENSDRFLDLTTESTGRGGKKLSCSSTGAHCARNAILQVLSSAQTHFQEVTDFNNTDQLTDLFCLFPRKMLGHLSFSIGVRTVQREIKLLCRWGCPCSFQKCP